ncbi:MAG: hypothetical protein AAGM22_18500 [Acidobacteriota bacterium]
MVFHGPQMWRGVIIQGVVVGTRGFIPVVMPRRLDAGAGKYEHHEEGEETPT